MNDVVKTQGLCKQFGTHLAVDHVDMTIQKGDIYGLIGQNGAGKTTFMRMLCGLAAPTSGSMALFGSTELEAQRHKLGCTIENPALYPAMTAAENLEVYRLLLGIDDETVIPGLLEFVGLHNVKHKKAKDFSLGMKQRLMIAIALLGDPELLVLDEPMNGLDPFGIKEVRDLLLKLNQEKGLTIVVSSHILEELSKITTRYGVIHQGRMVKEFSAEELEEDCKRKLRLCVDDPDAAAKLLGDHITADLERLPGGDIAVLDHLDQGAEITKLLVNGGVGVRALIPEEQNLEEYFMGLIGGVAK
ncbi:MAG: ATP-binding cassette domain-containing protein [Eubacteriales bacterium]|nr:ATP-binding cassette domain-containing protein [Eubacteriales bacterium]